MSLVYDALIRALVRERSLLAYRRQNARVLAVNPQDVDNPYYDHLRRVSIYDGIGVGPS